jgi:hypothetical protein
MRSISCLLLLIFCHQLCKAQNFSKAKIYTKKNSVIECFIKNTTYEGTPQKFSYTLTKEAALKTISAGEIQKVELEDGIIYENYYINVPVMSKDYLDRKEADYNFAENTLKAPVLVEKLITGPMALYQFVDRFGYPHFFYHTASDSSIVLLPYKTFLSDSGEIKYDQSYKNLLAFLFQQYDCKRSLTIQLDILQYTLNPMLRLFKGINSCAGQTVEANSDLYNKHVKPEIAVMAGIASTALHFAIYNEYLFPGLSENAFSNSTSALIGISISLVPRKIVKNYRASFELFYHSYKSETDSIHYNSYTTGKGRIKFSMLSLSPNLCFFLSRNNIKPFIEGGFVISKIVSKEDRYEYYASGTKYSFPIFKNKGTDFMALAGIGINFSRIVVGLRYQLSIIRSATYYNFLSATVKATLFK